MSLHEDGWKNLILFNSFQVLFRATQCSWARKRYCLQELRPGNSIGLQKHRQWRCETEQGWHSLLCLWNIRPLWPGNEDEDYNSIRECTFNSSFNNFWGFYSSIFCHLSSACYIIKHLSALLSVVKSWSLQFLLAWSNHFVWIFETSQIIVNIECLL